MRAVPAVVASSRIAAGAAAVRGIVLNMLANRRGRHPALVKARGARGGDRHGGATEVTTDISG